ncbi:MAG: flagellar biosynthetic protein FliR [Bacillota bacterium]
MLETLTNLLPLQLDYFLLLMLRVSALIFTSPIFGRRNIPPMVKIGFCLVLTYILYVTYPPKEALQYGHVLVFAFMCIKELVFGLILGFVTTAFFNLVFTSGQIIDMHMGFGMAGVMDVQSETQVPMVGNLLNIVLVIVFFGVNGHQQLISMLSATVKQIPLGQVAISPDIAFVAAEVFALTFLLAVNVAMPVIAAALLGEATMGILLRTVPQMNVFVVGIPVKIIIGLAMLLFMMPVYVGFTGTIFTNMFSSIEKLFSGLIGAV